MIAVERVDDYINDVPHEDCFSNLSEVSGCLVFECLAKSSFPATLPIY